MSDSQLSRNEANLALVRRFFACFAAGDLDTLREKVLAPDVIWHVPGRHPLSGTHRGVDEMLAFFAQLGASGFQADLQFLQADDEQVVDVHRGWSSRKDGSDIDLIWVLVYRIENGRITEARNFVSDQAAADTFFLNAYPLAPLPDRLASV
jgi:ketosteroid isomerase-like protein